MNHFEKNEYQIWKKLAKQVIDNGWSKNDVEDIADDLQELTRLDSGFEMAKDLEMWGGSVYDIKTKFIEWLDNLDSEFNKLK